MEIGISSLMTVLIIIFINSLPDVNCLKCYVCDGIDGCKNPRERECSSHDGCFTVADSYDVRRNGLKKGCAPTCDRVNIHGKLCRTCSSNLCNGKAGLGLAFDKPGPLPPRGPFGPHSGASISSSRQCVTELLLIIIVTHTLVKTFHFEN